MIPSSGRPISNIGQPISVSDESQDVHRIEKIPVPATYKPNYYKRCKKCAEKKIRKDTCHRCSSCPGKPAICLECFKTQHE